MHVVIKGAAFLAALAACLGVAPPSPAQAPEASSPASDESGSVIVFPKFVKGMISAGDTTRARTEIEIRARCPIGTTCLEAETVKIKFHWVCPGSDDFSSKYICKAAGFDLSVPVNGKVFFNPEDPKLEGSDPASAAPCPSGYLIGWVISPDAARPIKYDGLVGDATLRNGSGAIQRYPAIAIQAEPNLASRADIATNIDPRTGTPALVFDGGAGHYQPLAGAVPPELEYHKLTGPLSSSEAFLILLTLDVRLNRPNYPTFIDLDFRSNQGIRASTSWNFICWTEIQNPNVDEYFTLAGARTRNGVAIAGQAVKVRFGGISDIPGPVTLLGLVPTDEGSGYRAMDPAHIVKRFDNSKPTTVLVPLQ